MGIRQRCWTAIALYLLSLPGSQLTSANAMVSASGGSGTNAADSRVEPALNHIGIVNNRLEFMEATESGRNTRSL